jgi:hypothetical protein
MSLCRFAVTAKRLVRLTSIDFKTHFALAHDNHALLAATRSGASSG